MGFGRLNYYQSSEHNTKSKSVNICHLNAQLGLTVKPVIEQPIVYEAATELKSPMLICHFDV